MIDSVDFLSVLGTGLWHTTSPLRYAGIQEAGAILPEPQVPDAERWKTARGPKHYPFVRFLGGVSLFEFLNFDQKAYDSYYVFSSWREFLPYRRAWGSSVWLEIDRQQVRGSFINAKDLVAKWKAENGQGHDYMPMIEAAHIGPVPISAITRVLLVDEEALAELGRPTIYTTKR